MSNGPVPGDGVAITLPTHRMVFWAVRAQSGLTQHVSLKDSQGRTVFTCRGQANPGEIGQGMFQTDAAGSYSVHIASDAGPERVLWDEGVVALGEMVYFGQHVFVGEDGTDEDFNDCCLHLRWFGALG